MRVTICDICGKPLNGDNKMFLPEIMGIVYGGVRGGKCDYDLEEKDVCQDCQEQIYDFIEVLKENKNDSV